MPGPFIPVGEAGPFPATGLNCLQCSPVPPPISAAPGALRLCGCSRIQEFHPQSHASSLRAGNSFNCLPLDASTYAGSPGLRVFCLARLHANDCNGASSRELQRGETSWQISSLGTKIAHSMHHEQVATRRSMAILSLATSEAPVIEYRRPRKVYLDSPKT